jgi:hypothetical protein
VNHLYNVESVVKLYHTRRITERGEHKSNKERRVTLPGLSEVALKVGANTGIAPGTCIAACLQFLIRKTEWLKNAESCTSSFKRLRKFSFVSLQCFGDTR